MKISEISSTFCMVYECYKRPAEIGDSKPLVPKKKLHGRIAVNSVNISFSPNKSCFGYFNVFDKSDIKSDGRSQLVIFCYKKCSDEFIDLYNLEFTSFPSKFLIPPDLNYFLER